MASVEVIEDAHRMLGDARRDQAERKRQHEKAKRELRQLEAQREQAAREGGPSATVELREQIVAAEGRVEDAAAYAQAAEAPVSAARRHLAEMIEQHRPALVAAAVAWSEQVEHRRARIVEELRQLDAEERAAYSAWQAVHEGRDRSGGDVTWQTVVAASDAHLHDGLAVRVGNLNADARMPGRAVDDLVRLDAQPIRVSGRQLGEQAFEGYQFLALLRTVRDHLATASALPAALLQPMPNGQGDAGVYRHAATGAERAFDAVEAREHRDELLPDSLGMCAWRRVRDLTADEAAARRHERATLGENGQVIPDWDGQSTPPDNRHGVELGNDDSPQPWLEWMED